MTLFRRSLFDRSLAVLVILWLAIASFASVPVSHAADEESAAPSDDMADVARQALSGGNVPSDIRQVLDSRPDLKEKLVQDAKRTMQEEGKSEVAAKGSKSGVATSKDSDFAAPLLPAYDWKVSPYVKSLFLARLGDNEARTLPHFGHDLFSARPIATSRLPENLPVAPSYLIGPGDEFVVRTWGRLEGTHRLTVDRDGKVYLPKFGTIALGGKSFDEAKGILKAKFGTIAEVQSDVAMGSLKAVRVSVLGDVRLPGWFNVSSLHTALQAVYLAGGVKDTGSLRKISISRGGKTAETVDLYDFMLSGDPKGDLRLLPGDSIFVPVVGPLVAVVGEVRRDAIYELAGEKTLIDVVKMAGGFAPSAFKRKVQVERLAGNESRVVMDADAEAIEKGAGSFEVADGDIIRVLPIVRADENVVTLEGNVRRPGKYELKAGMTVGSLLADETSFLPETDFDYAVVTRRIPPDFAPETIPVSLRKAVFEKKKDADLLLKGRDVVKVFPRSAFRDAPKATISGEVRLARKELQAAPKTEKQATVGKADVEKADVEKVIDQDVLSFEIRPGMRVSDLVKLAGGLTRTALLEKAEVVRAEGGRTFRTLYFDLGKAMAGDVASDLLLQDEDVVRVHSIHETLVRKTVSASGEVNRPGEILLTEGMKLSDLLFKAGGLRESAFAREAELVRRERAPGGELVKVSTLVVSPEKVMAGDAASDVSLREHDILVVRQVPEWGEKVVVKLSGEVRFPGAYTARKGERLSSILKRAGGFTPGAYLKAARFTRESTRKSQQESINKLTEELEGEIARASQASVADSLDKEDIEAGKALLQARRTILGQLKRAKANGRVIVKLDAPERIEGTSADILVEDNDALVVPPKPNVVSVVGRVYNPTGIVFDPTNDSAGHYLDTVGGPMASADKSQIFLLRADGSVVTNATASGSSWFNGSALLSSKVEPGDSIIVPEKLIHGRVMKDVKDFTQILYQIAVTAGVLIVAF